VEAVSLLTVRSYTMQGIHTGDGQNNGNTRQYRNKIVSVGCTERTLVVSFVILLFVYAV